tara:strand:+ start:185 stop:706 length:522 start_codon:yes stop_codon:yes gene_type:complete
MNSLILKNIISFILIVILQVLILNNVLFMGYINPYVYILFLLTLPFNTKRWLILILALILGLTIDSFQNSMGLHAFSCILIAYFRSSIIKFLLPELKNKNKKSINFSINEFGIQRFIIYSSIMVIIHHFSLFFIESFNLEIFNNIIRASISSIFSIVIIILLQFLFFKTGKND